MRSKRHLAIEKQVDMIILEWLFNEGQTPKKIKKLYSPEILKQIARKNIKINDKYELKR